MKSIVTILSVLAMSSSVLASAASSGNPFLTTREMNLRELSQLKNQEDSQVMGARNKCFMDQVQSLNVLESEKQAASEQIMIDCAAKFPSKGSGEALLEQADSLLANRILTIPKVRRAFGPRLLALKPKVTEIYGIGGGLTVVGGEFTRTPVKQMSSCGERVNAKKQFTMQINIMTGAIVAKSLKAGYQSFGDGDCD